MLVLFAFSITPKKILHDLVADHKDTPVKTSDSKTPQFDVSGFRCNCDNLVVESPFLNEGPALEIILTSFYFTPPVETDNNLSVVHLYYATLRGPPLAV
jgi:hypothetical protein